MQALLSYISNLDSTILYATQSVGPAWRPVAMFLSYGVGSYFILLGAFVIALILIEKWRVSVELVVIAFLSFAAVFVFKYLFHADRPFMIDPAVIVYDRDTGYGLPSAHAVMAVVIFGWVALRHPKSHVLAWGSIALIILIGVSRVYLGVHYPSQVLAGWIFGGLLLYIFCAIDKRLWPAMKKRIR
ncbi:phosphatase PAP2 family protein [Candidatus Parcubacteria bacterium]|nr:phosphatase PAP2 family protein [Candidatus Parcubacteria bacterium]